ncbi:hypothetical protein CAEBREN_13387 [Caenorhabditis brenneri]|uniref:PAN-3 domain-containing protein n=1 Tax=Caenorhabditis brenneri TaxID=135651 RepID=G0P2J8_CAEBE|nr:hypothetical protein CAEBREN_13387 [Caenorhabditis brenneri]
MLLFWGYPTQDTTYCVNKSPAGAFERCIDLCLGSDSCMLSYGNDSTCILCDIFTVTSIIQSDSSENTKLAIKVDQQNQCPEDVQSNQYTKSDPYGNSYELSFNGSSWTVTYPKSCPNRLWRMFPRTIGPFCLRVDTSTERITRNSALRYCRVLFDGGYLAGVTSAAEYNHVLSVAKKWNSNSTNYDYLGVWISGLKKSECESTQVAGCSGINAFQEFPGQTTFDYYNFPPGYPNFAMRGTGSVYSRCLQLVWAQQKSAFDGKVINAACEYPCNEAETICAYSFACGVLAT